MQHERRNDQNGAREKDPTCGRSSQPSRPEPHQGFHALDQTIMTTTVVLLSWRRRLFSWKTTTLVSTVALFTPTITAVAYSTISLPVFRCSSLAFPSRPISSRPPHSFQPQRQPCFTSLHSVMTPSSSNPPQPRPPQHKLQFVDIGANLLDDRYVSGTYHGKVRHDPDLEEVLKRAARHGVTHLIVTAGTVQESRQAVKAVRKWRQQQQQLEDQNIDQGCDESLLSSLYVACTVGVHPTRCLQEFGPLSTENNGGSGGDDNAGTSNSSTTTATTTTTTATKTAQDVLNELREIALDGVSDGAVVAIGEIGLDYDRLQFSPKDLQQEFFRRQLETMLLLTKDGQVDYSPDMDRTQQLSQQVATLPLFLHNRSVGRDLLDMLQSLVAKEHESQRPPLALQGVIHSFDDSLELAQSFIDMGLYIGINGCSLKSQENLGVVRDIPLTSILLETDCPYCEIKATHAGYKYISTSFQDMKKAEKNFEMGKMVKGRNEPCQIVQVAEVIAGVRGISVQEVADQCYENSLKLYGWDT